MRLREFIGKGPFIVDPAFGDNGINVISLIRFGLEISALGTALGKFKDSTSDLGDMTVAESALTFFEGLKNRLEAAKLKETIGYFDENKVDVGALDAFGLQIAALGNSLGRSKMPSMSLSAPAVMTELLKRRIPERKKTKRPKKRIS